MSKSFIYQQTVSKFLESYINNASPTGLKVKDKNYGLTTLNPMLMIILLTLWYGGGSNQSRGKL